MEAPALPGGRAVRGGAQHGRVLRHARQVRAGLLAHDDVPGLRDQRAGVPLAIPEPDDGRFADGTAICESGEDRTSGAVLRPREEAERERRDDALHLRRPGGLSKPPRLGADQHGVDDARTAAGVCAGCGGAGLVKYREGLR